MKAKEYAEKIASTTNEVEYVQSLNDCIHGLYKEFQDLMKARNVKFDRSLAPLWHDIDRKWRNIASIVNAKKSDARLKNEGFAEYTRSKFPDLWNIVKN